jgi:hypothetical protein
MITASRQWNDWSPGSLGGRCAVRGGAGRHHAGLSAFPPLCAVALDHCARWQPPRLRRGRAAAARGAGSFVAEALAAAGAGGNGLAINATLNHPRGAAITPDGTVFIADTGNNSIQVVDLAGHLHGQVGYEQTRDPTAGVAGMGVDIDGTGYWANADDNSVSALDKANELADIIPAPMPGAEMFGLSVDDDLNRPAGVAVDSNGNVHTADTGSNAIKKVDSAGHIGIVAGTQESGFFRGPRRGHPSMLDHPQGVAVAADGTLYIADTGNHRLRQIDKQGTITTIMQ